MPPVDHLVAQLADRQHGVVAYRQLIALGLSRWQIEDRVRQGRLFRVYRGVYAVGRRGITREGQWMAATLAAGDGAVLSHRSAAALWCIAKPTARHEVSVPTTAGRAGPRAITLHRTSSLPESEATRREGIPVTSLPRTLLDLAEAVERRDLERALDEAQFLRCLDLRAVRGVIAAHIGRTGAKRLARALDEHVVGTTHTNDGLEERFFALCRSAGIPDPLVKQTIGPYEVDFLWPDAKLVVETDDRSHKRNANYENDRDRDGYLQELGYRVRRFTSKKVTDEPDEVERSLKALLYPANTEATAAKSPSAGATATGIRQVSPAARTSSAPPGNPSS